MEQIDSQEFTEWQAYYQVAPWGQWIDAVHFARLMSCVMAGHGVKVDPQDLLLKFEPPAPPSKLELFERIQAAAATTKAIATARGDSKKC